MQTPVDIVLPCYNPNSNWHNALLDFYAKTKDLYSLNFIIVNDGSTNANVEDHIHYLRLQNIPLQYLSYKKNKGKGYALRQGVSASSAYFIVYTDIDFPFTNKSTIGVIEALLNEEADVIAGYRNQNYYQKNTIIVKQLQD